MSQTAQAQNIATIKKPTLVGRFAGRYHVEPEKLLSTLKATAFKANREVSNAELMALLVVADQYKLNPFTREIFAFPDKHKGIVPVVSVDGWSRIINEHPQCDGFEFRYSDTAITMDAAKPCPEWCECIIYRKDRAHPSPVREYLDEVYRPPFKQEMQGPWQTHTKRFLRHKALIQAARIVFGFADIYDEDEAMRIVEGVVIDMEPGGAPPAHEDFRGPEPEPEPEPFEAPQSPDPFMLHDQYGEMAGEFADAEEFAAKAVETITAITLAAALDAFMEANAEEFERLGPTRTTPVRQQINRAFNDRKSVLQQTPPDEQEPDASAPPFAPPPA